MKTIKTVLIGAGYRGMRLYHLMRAIPQFNVVAVFDPCCTPEVDSTIACYGQDAYAYLTMLDECKPQFTSSRMSGAAGAHAAKKARMAV